VQSLAAGRRFLNLFCYTGSFSVYAAAGAETSTSVDLSNTYLDWARRNFELNGMDAGRHRLDQADARRFVGTRPSPGSATISSCSIHPVSRTRNACKACLTCNVTMWR